MPLARMRRTFLASVSVRLKYYTNQNIKDELKWATRHWATRIGVKIDQLHIRPMTGKWASMSTAGRLTLNTELLQLPRELGEYVLVEVVMRKVV